MAQERRHPQVANLDEIDGRSTSTGARFGATMKHLGRATGARGIGCTWYEVAPGRSAFPRHFHCAMEESLFVLEGAGTVRIGDATVPLRAGDYVTFPTGPDSAHILTNTGSAPLRYLCFSTLHAAEVVGYPDSKKIGAMAAGSYEAAMKGQTWVRHLSFASAAAGYFDGEDVG
jgi:uncharacterized cupin superfamily protein